MIGPTCPDCGYVHSAADVFAVGRFSPEPTTYVVAHGGQVRATRAEAEDDECAWRRARTPTVPPPFTPSLTSRPPAVIVEQSEPAPFPAVAMETAARAKAWGDFLAQIRLSLMVWEIDGEVRAGCEHVLAWLRRCGTELAGLGVRPTQRRGASSASEWTLFDLIDEATR